MGRLSGGLSAAGKKFPVRPSTPGSGNVDTTFHFMNTNGLGSNNNRANVNIDGILYVGSGRQSGETLQFHCEDGWTREDGEDYEEYAN